MKEEQQGWVIINENHPSGAKPFISITTFKALRKDTISEFIRGSGQSWEYWRKKWNFRCVRATIHISAKSKK